MCGRGAAEQSSPRGWQGDQGRRSGRGAAEVLQSRVLDNPVGQGEGRDRRRGLSWSWPRAASRFQRCPGQKQQGRWMARRCLCSEAWQGRGGSGSSSQLHTSPLQRVNWIGFSSSLGELWSKPQANEGSRTKQSIAR